jgi:hypothetical protein
MNFKRATIVLAAAILIFAAGLIVIDLVLGLTPNQANAVFPFVSNQAVLSIAALLEVVVGLAAVSWRHDNPSRSSTAIAWITALFVSYRALLTASHSADPCICGSKTLEVFHFGVADKVVIDLALVYLVALSIWQKLPIVMSRFRCRTISYMLIMYSSVTTSQAAEADNGIKVYGQMQCTFYRTPKGPKPGQPAPSGMPPEIFVEQVLRFEAAIAGPRWQIVNSEGGSNHWVRGCNGYDTFNLFFC